MSTDADPLTTAELDALDALNRARTPGRLCVAVSARGEFGIFGGADGEEWIATFPRGRGAEAEAFVAMCSTTAEARAIAAALNALPALLAEVRASRAAAVEVRAVATALALHNACLACDGEDQQDSCLYHESHELSARLLAALDGKGASK